MSDPTEPASQPASSPVGSPASPPAATSSRDRVLLVAFWAWAAILVVATIAQLFRIEPVLDVLDVKNWFAR